MRILFLCFFAILVTVGSMEVIAVPIIANTADISPTTIALSTPTVVTVTFSIDDPSLIPNGVNLLRANGTASILIGVLHDDGQNGDLVAGDNIYTIRVVLNEPAIQQVPLQISAAFRGVLKRFRINLPIVFVQPANAPTQAISGLIGELQTGNITAALKRFAPSQSTTKVLTNLTTTARAALASALSTATLVTTGPDLRIFKAVWVQAGGMTTSVEFWMVPDDSGQWIISNW